MLKDNFFFIKCVEVNDLELIFSLSINESHEIFEDHFPNQPVTPGVTLIQMVEECLEEYFQKKLKVKTIANVKFLNVLNPTESNQFNIVINYIENSEELKVKAVGENDEKVFFKLSGIYLFS